MQLAVQTNTTTVSETVASEPMAMTGNAVVVQITEPQPGETQAIERLTILVLKSNETYKVTKYQRDGDLLMFVDTQGRKGGVDVNEVDWRKTTQMTSAAHSGDKMLLSRQTN